MIVKNYDAINKLLILNLIGCSELLIVNGIKSKGIEQCKRFNFCFAQRRERTSRTLPNDFAVFNLSE